MDSKKIYEKHLYTVKNIDTTNKEINKINDTLIKKIKKNNDEIKKLNMLLKTATDNLYHVMH